MGFTAHIWGSECLDTKEAMATDVGKRFSFSSVFPRADFDISRLRFLIPAGDRRQATGDKRQATGDKRQATGDRRQATDNRRRAFIMLLSSHYTTGLIAFEFRELSISERARVVYVISSSSSSSTCPLFISQDSTSLNSSVWPSLCLSRGGRTEVDGKKAHDADDGNRSHVFLFYVRASNRDSSYTNAKVCTH